MSSLLLTTPVIHANKKDQDILAKYKNEDTFKTRAMKFFKVRATSFRDTEKASERFLSELSNITKKP